MGSTKVPETPAVPTASQNMQDWIANYPAMFALQQEYAPQEAAQQVSLAQQYAQPLGEAMKAANDAMYPETSKLQEELAAQSLAGMQEEMPSWAKDSYLNNVRANLGTNAGSGIGADYTSRGLLEQQKSWGDYYRNLGLSTAGRQPLTQAASPSYSNYASTYTPTSVANTNSTNYGTAANIYGTQVQSASNQSNSWLNLLGSGIGAAGTIGGASILSSARYKRNIELWA